MEQKTSAGLVAWCRQNEGMPYWYAMCGWPATREWLDKKIAQYPPNKYPKLWTPTRIAKARTEAGKFPRAFDCVGLIKGYLWVQPNGAIKYSAAQDVSADGMLAKCKEKGPIKTLPEIPGLLVFCPGHVGVYIGGGRVIEAYGFKNVENRPLSAQKWTTWGSCPYIQYPDTPAPDKPPQGPTEDTGGFKMGDRVRVKQTGIPYYPGINKIPAWVGDNVYTVGSAQPIGRGGKQCVLLSEIKTWCDIGNLEKVKE